MIKTVVAILGLALVNFCIGLITGFATREKMLKDTLTTDEKETYCRGFEDGIYFSVGEYQPSLFHIEIAERAYKEYKCFKSGPTKN